MIVGLYKYMKCMDNLKLHERTVYEAYIYIYHNLVKYTTVDNQVSDPKYVQFNYPRHTF